MLANLSISYPPLTSLLKRLRRQERQLQAPGAFQQNSFKCTLFVPCWDLTCQSEHLELHLHVMFIHLEGDIFSNSPSKLLEKKKKDFISAKRTSLIWSVSVTGITFGICNWNLGPWVWWMDGIARVSTLTAKQSYNFSGVVTKNKLRKWWYCQNVASIVVNRDTIKVWRAIRPSVAGGTRAGGLGGCTVVKERR